ncbi:MAG: hypothetical protein N4A72_07815 [Bacteroidales bacterium]|jgi:hypothetical protein|nr:hypothetical protein [Bacteroidales bacterium]
MRKLRGGFLKLGISIIVILFSGFLCKGQVINFNGHLKELCEFNSSIDSSGWRLLQRIDYPEELYLSFEKTVGDTVFTVMYSKLDGVKVITDFTCKLTKSYVNDGKYFEWSVKNGDTLYYYNTDCTVEDGLIYKAKEKNFFFGRYYFLYLEGGVYNSKQRLFFESNIDSLIKIKGNNLPDLPSY